MTKTRLAVVVAAMFAVPAGVAALEQSASSPEAAEMSAPVESAATVEPVTGAEQAPTEQAIGIAPVEPAIPVEDRVRNIMNLQRVAAPLYQDEPGSALLPSQIAYLERMEAQRGHLIARGDAFPASDSPDDRATLPAQLAHFDRLDQTRVAAMNGSPVVAESRPVEGIVVAEASPAQ